MKKTLLQKEHNTTAQNITTEAVDAMLLTHMLSVTGYQAPES